MANRVLAVDDDRDLLRMLTLILQHAGYEVLPARSGNEALTILGSEIPDIVLLDVMMPDISGLEICRWLRANPSTSKVPIIMLTAKALQQDKALGFEAGVDDYLTKPVSHTELLMRIKSLLRRATIVPSAVGSTSQLIGFVGAKGGVGTTTVAINVAATLIASERDVILVDLETITSASVALNLPIPQVNDLIGGQQEVLADTTLLRNHLVQHTSGVKVLSLPSQWHFNGTALNSEQLQTLFHSLTGLAPYVLVDIGAGLTPLTRRALAYVDRIIVVTEPDRSALEIARGMLVELRNMSKAQTQIGLICVNRTGGGLSRSPAEMERLLGTPILGFITPASEVCFQANQHGLPVVSAYPSSIIAEQIRSIATRLQ